VGVSLTDYETGAKAKFFSPTAPTYTMRVGLVDRLDFGFRVANFSSIGGDIKWNFIKSEVIDLAIDPSIQYYHLGGSSSSSSDPVLEEWSADILRLNGVLLVGINAGKTLTLMPTLGVAYTEALGSYRGVTSLEIAQGSSGVAARIGLGLNIRASAKFAVQPEVTVLRPLQSRADEGVIYVIGVGFNIGKLPIYDEEAAPPPAAPGASAPGTQYPPSAPAPAPAPTPATQYPAPAQ